MGTHIFQLVYKNSTKDEPDERIKKCQNSSLLEVIESLRVAYRLGYQETV